MSSTGAGGEASSGGTKKRAAAPQPEEDDDVAAPSPPKRRMIGFETLFAEAETGAKTGAEGADAASSAQQPSTGATIVTLEMATLLEALSMFQSSKMETVNIRVVANYHHPCFYETHGEGKAGGDDGDESKAVQGDDADADADMGDGGDGDEGGADKLVPSTHMLPDGRFVCEEHAEETQGDAMVVAEADLFSGIIIYTMNETQDTAVRCHIPGEVSSLGTNHMFALVTKLAYDDLVATAKEAADECTTCTMTVGPSKYAGGMDMVRFAPTTRQNNEAQAASHTVAVQRALVMFTPDDRLIGDAHLHQMKLNASIAVSIPGAVLDKLKLAKIFPESLGTNIELTVEHMKLKGRTALQADRDLFCIVLRTCAEEGMAQFIFGSTHVTLACLVQNTDGTTSSVGPAVVGCNAAIKLQSSVVVKMTMEQLKREVKSHTGDTEQKVIFKRKFPRVLVVQLLTWASARSRSTSDVKLFLTPGEGRATMATELPGRGVLLANIAARPVEDGDDVV